MKAANYCVFQSYGVILLTYLGPHDVTGLRPSRPLHKWPPVKSAPASCAPVFHRHLAYSRLLLSGSAFMGFEH